MVKNILLAEDDRGTALLVKTQLEKKGYYVYTAGNGVEALKILSAQSVDLIITDVVMPKMDGVDLYAAVKKNPATANIPIIIVTDKAMFKESFTTLGVSNFVEKTSDIRVLLEKITAIEQHAQAIKKYSKILINSSHGIVEEQIKSILKGKNYLVTSARTSDEVLSKALTMVPHAIIMDVLFQDNASAAHELIRALRCFGTLANTKIITYAYFPEDLGIDVDAVQSVEEAMAQCSQAGSDKYIGRFNQGLLVERLGELGI